MNKKQLVLAIVFLFILVGLGIVALKKQSKSWDKTSSTGRTELLSDLDVNKITKVKVTNNTNSTTVEKKNDRWGVANRNDYPVNYKKLSDGLLNLQSLKVAQYVKAGKSKFGRLKLEHPGSGDKSGILVELFDSKGDKLVGALLGKEHFAKQENPNPMFGGPRPDGRYIILESDKDQPLLVSQTLSNFTAKPTDWLKKDFLKLEKIEAIILQTSNPENNWVLSRKDEKSDFTLQGLEPGRELEKSKITSISNGFNYLSFNDVLPKDTKPDETGLNKADTLKVVSFDNFAYTMKIASKGKKCYMQLTDVRCDIPKTRKAKQDEKPADKAKLDQAFEAKNKQLKEKRDVLSFYKNWIYEVPKAKFETLIIPRKELVKEKNKKVQKGQVKDEGSNTVQATAPKD